jgi:hypothetical protein
MTTQQLISRDFHGATIRQRSDGYLNATDMCQASGKRLNNYFRLKSTKAFLVELSDDTKLPISSLIEIRQGGIPDIQGTWVHPKMLNHFTTWVTQTPSDQPEKTIQLRLQAELGGEIEVKTPVGPIDLFTDNEIIEIKKVENWKSALGQILIYGKHYPNHQKRIHLFGKSSNGNLTFKAIEEYYAEFNVILTIEK